MSNRQVRCRQGDDTGPLNPKPQTGTLAPECECNGARGAGIATWLFCTLELGSTKPAIDTKSVSLMALSISAKPKSSVTSLGFKTDDQTYTGASSLKEKQDL